MHLDTKAIHIGRSIDPATGAVSMPLHTSTTFHRGTDGAFPSGFEYIRDANPTRNAFETAMASLEGGSAALAFSSGMAAITAVFEGHATDGRIVVPDDMYFGIRSLIEETDIGRRFEFVAVDMRDLVSVRAAVAAAPPGLVLDRNAIEPADPRRRYPRSVQDRTRGRRACDRGQHLGDTRAAASARTWRRCRHALGHEVYWRTFRSHGRRCSRSRGIAVGATAAHDPATQGKCGRTLRLLAGSARFADLATANAGTLRGCAEDGGSTGWSSSCREGAVPRLAGRSGPCARAAANERLRRNALLRCSRWGRGGNACHRSAQARDASHKPLPAPLFSDPRRTRDAR